MNAEAGRHTWYMKHTEVGETMMFEGLDGFGGSGHANRGSACMNDMETRGVQFLRFRRTSLIRRPGG